MKIVKTKDGTNTLYSDKYNQHYHSISDGALNESIQKHVFPAFKYIKKQDEYNILDICYGLGFNTLSTLYYINSNEIKAKVNIVSVELDVKLVKDLKNFIYPQEFTPYKNIIKSISKYGEYHAENINIKIHFNDARAVLNDLNTRFDIIYQDPFSYDCNPTLWSVEYFKQLNRLTKDESIITTYSQSSKVRYSAYNAGFNSYIYEGKNSRASTIFSKLGNLELKKVDFAIKLKNNPSLSVLSDNNIT